MENASKALLMAGGVLIALMIIGALLLMFNQLGSYQKQNYTTEAEKQLAQFNQEFAQYTDEDIKGTDLITLVNKVVDYNQKSGGVNSLNYDIKITLNINMDKFAQKYGTNYKSELFGTTTSYKINSGSNTENNEFLKIIKTYTSLENKYGLDNLKKLLSNYDNINNGSKTIQDVLGGSVSVGSDLDLSVLAKYREYSEFKTSVFKRSDGSPTYSEGQISGLSFYFTK